jgi:predicted RNA-binding Zn-ribbon protein involved in translation (DUF1610 family)
MEPLTCPECGGSEIIGTDEEVVRVTIRYGLCDFNGPHAVELSEERETLDRERGDLFACEDCGFDSPDVDDFVPEQSGDEYELDDHVIHIHV